ncbi:acyltransferase family protein [soil metagenome]
MGAARICVPAHLGVMTQTLIRPMAPVEKPNPVPVLDYRPALDGMRGIAVLAVIAYHLDVPGFGGGFLGVDLFFVLSGALITALLLLEHDVRGRVDVARFWARRARRLLPAVLLLLAVVVPVARTDIGIRGDALATLGYVANWRFAAQARSYFAEAAALSPLNHMWSLAIEEQFYIVWPLVMGLLARARRRLVTVLVGAAVVSIICLAWLFLTSDPSQAYYHTLARAHELVIGALAAVVLVRAGQRAQRLRALARTWLLPAVAVVVGATAMMGEAGTVYYLGGSVIFSVAVAVIILGLEGPHPSRLRRLLSWRPLVTVGTLSYGLYLWHWPFVVLLRRLGFEGPVFGVAVVALTAAFAVTSARLVERPVRAGTLWRAVVTTRRSLVASTVALALGAGVVVAVTPARLQPAWTRAVTGDPTVIVAAPASHTTPDDTAGRTVEDHEHRTANGARSGDDRRSGSREPLVIGVVGDSAAASMLPGIAAAAERRGDEVVSVAARGCPMVPVWQLDENGHSVSYSQDCRRHVQTAFDELVNRHDPDLVLWYSGRDTQTRFIIDGRPAAPDEPRHTATVRWGFERAVERLTAKGADLVIVRSLPRHGSTVTDCDRPPASGVRWCDGVDRYAGPTGQNALYEELAQRHPQVTLISQASLVCGSGRVCDDAMTDFERWRSDLTHFGGSGALRIGEAIVADALAESGND